MFHLLTSHGGWQDSSDTVSNSRIYIRRDRAHEAPFRNPDGSLNPNKIREIPALLTPEPCSDAEQLAKVVHITDINERARDTEIQYTIDISIPPMPVSALEEYESLAPGNFGLNHSCWRIINSDLFKMLYRINLRTRISPTLFSIESSYNTNENLISLMMPFSAEFNDVHASIRNVSEELGTVCQRADDIWEDSTVIQDIVTLISRSKVVICDCTGKNPNVFYEAGIAHTLGKEVILIAQNSGDIPFDLRHIRYITYLNNGEGLETLEQQLTRRIRTILSK